MERVKAQLQFASLPRSLWCQAVISAVSSAMFYLYGRPDRLKRVAAGLRPGGVCPVRVTGHASLPIVVSGVRSTT